MKHLVMYSGGIVSWATANRVVERHGPDDVTLAFADTLIEDPDLYRFVDETVASLGCKLVKLADGRDPWQVFFDVRMIGSSRRDPCSRILKRELLDRWRKQNFDPADTIVYIGYDWTEMDRLERMQDRIAPWHVEAPMTEKPYLARQDMIAMLKEKGIEPPFLYSQGFQHNNCGGRCVKAGHGHWKLLLDKLPDRYKEWEEKEQEFRAFIGKDVSILRDRTGRGGPMTLKTFRERYATDSEQLDMFDIGGCNCFGGEDDDTPEPEPAPLVRFAV